MTVYLWNENTNVKGVLDLAVATHKLTNLYLHFLLADH